MPSELPVNEQATRAAAWLRRELSTWITADALGMTLMARIPDMLDTICAENARLTAHLSAATQRAEDAEARCIHYETELGNPGGALAAAVHWAGLRGWSETSGDGKTPDYLDAVRHLGQRAEAICAQAEAERDAAVARLRATKDGRTADSVCDAAERANDMTAEVARLTQERDAAVKAFADHAGDLTQALTAADAEVSRLKAAIRQHRDEKGHDRCWLSDQELYAVLGEESGDARLPPRDEFLANCERYYTLRRGGQWSLPPDEVATLKAALGRLRDAAMSFRRSIIVNDDTSRALDRLDVALALSDADLGREAIEGAEVRGARWAVATYRVGPSPEELDRLAAEVVRAARGES